MKLAIITHVPHIPQGDTYAGYGPYVREMNLWAKYADSLEIAAPIAKGSPDNIHLPYDHTNVRVFHVPSMAFTSLGKGIMTLLNLPVILFQLWRVMRRADHIHLRCPGTLGLMGCFVQILFPRKPKTAKYAGNWDPNAKQPFSYRLQKKLLSNTFLTRNMKVLVYGEWPNQTKNIVPFFTATYRESKIEVGTKRHFVSSFKFMFVGTLSPGKQPEYAVQLIKDLHEKGIPCQLDFYGDGVEAENVRSIVEKLQLDEIVTLHGNQTSETVEIAYKTSDFMVLPSRSEGWPKVVAEAMFWGCIPIASQVSCVPWMLGFGERGVLLEPDHSENVKQLGELLGDSDRMLQMSETGQQWSHAYTLDRFEGEIKSLLQ
ncbi:glycosyltransferase [Aureisphaera galaxeae]|uniref:glycosyltransferase family 4 protein n=1 Tax=Aureisphaera galaxeae TaxID=1538023 RepID=UPI00235091B4|nr:glycosyltransferase [Aureisphaera galaxeae]MDC8006308.1 glycosyltransferase [Aureisphaera galaxeae]